MVFWASLRVEGMMCSLGIRYDGVQIVVVGMTKEMPHLQSWGSYFIGEV